MTTAIRKSTGFQKSVESYDRVNNSCVFDQVEEDSEVDLGKPLISNIEISSTVVSSRDADTTKTVSPTVVKTSELGTNDLSHNAST